MRVIRRYSDPPFLWLCGLQVGQTPDRVLQHTTISTAFNNTHNIQTTTKLTTVLYTTIREQFYKDKNVLLAIGARHLREAVDAAHIGGARAFARILPSPESLRMALTSNLQESDLAILRPLQGEVVDESYRYDAE